MLQSASQKRVVSAALDNLVTRVSGGATIAEAVRYVEQTGLMKLIDPVVQGLELTARAEADVQEDERRRWRLFHALSRIELRKVRLYHEVLEQNMPYVTKHGVKGAEFDSVVVVLDDKGAGWNNYSFGGLLGGSDPKPERRRRTANLFYVCCSRARRNLIVVDFGYDDARKASVEALFGPSSVLVV